MSLHVGTSGFRYPDWAGAFYPADKPPGEWLRHYFGKFNSLELCLAGGPDDQQLLSQVVEAVPRGGSVSLVAPPGLLFGGEPAAVRAPVEQFYQWLAPLDDRLGVVLHAVPPSFRYNPDRLASYLDVLPAGVRHALEFRATEWYKERLRELLEAREVAFSSHDIPGAVTPDWHTARFHYVRMHAGQRSSKYTSDEIQALAQRLEPCLARGMEVYVYFLNAAAGAAVENARHLVTLLDHP